MPANCPVSLPTKSFTIMIVAGEASGDLHGANLVQAISNQGVNVSFFGMGGNAMADAGVDLLYDAARLSVVGLLEVFSHLKDIRKARNILADHMSRRRPDLLILIDFPDFNLSLAAKAKKLNIPVFYYISPQVWAWRSGRVKKIANLVNEMAVILPFEKEFYRQRGVNVHFVGHPLMDHVKSCVAPSLFRRQHGISAKRVVGILPGSRKKEVQTLLPVFLETAQNMSNHFKEEIVFLLALAPSLTINDLQCSELLNNMANVIVIEENRYDLMASCDVVMAASGTVTLELAILNIPMVVAYKISPLTYFMVKRLIKVQFAALVNLVANEKIVAELLQDKCNPENIESSLVEIWPDRPSYHEMKDKLQQVCERLGGPGASQRTAQIVIDLLG